MENNADGISRANLGHRGICSGRANYLPDTVLVCRFVDGNTTTAYIIMFVLRRAFQSIYLVDKQYVFIRKVYYKKKNHSYRERRFFFFIRAMPERVEYCVRTASTPIMNFSLFELDYRIQSTDEFQLISLLF